MVSGQKVVYYEATPWFGGIAGQPGETEGTPDVAAMLRRTDLVSDVAMYLAYEAADAVVRMENCKLDLQGVVLQMLPDFYLQGSQLKRLNQLFADQQIQKEKLVFTIPATLVRDANKGTQEVLERYLRNGIRLLVDEYNPSQLPPERLKDLGFRELRLTPALYLKQETANAMETLRNDGFTLWGGHADTHDVLAWLQACGVVASGGTITGSCVNEDDLIRNSLMREQRNE